MRRNTQQNASDGGQQNSAKLMRNQAEANPMSKFDRLKLKFSIDKTPSTQFYIVPKEQRACFVSFLWKLLNDRCRKTFRNLVFWRISTSYMNFFVQSLIFFFIYIHIFALLIYWVITGSYRDHGAQCANTNQDWFYVGTNTIRHNMEIAFELSWITFTTVGYGNVAPSGSISGCWGLRYLCAFEAFVGIVYFSLLGAIFFKKIGITFEEAPVTFSRALCLKYDASSDGFPVLEMQIVHNKANQEGHEVLNASLLCIVAIDVPFIYGQTSTVQNVKSLSRSIDIQRRPSLADAKHQPSFYSHSRGTKQTYYTIKLEGGEHPYFNRVWHCHHILNGDSPLINDVVKEEIKKSGSWPFDKYSHNEIRSALVPFHTMLVTMRGTSVRHSGSVYSEKRYNFDDIYIGCKFASLMYLCSNEQEAMVDRNLIHDIVPQCEDVAEPVEECLMYRRQNQHIVTVNTQTA